MNDEWKRFSIYDVKCVATLHFYSLTTIIFRLYLWFEFKIWSQDATYLLTNNNILSGMKFNIFLGELRIYNNASESNIRTVNIAQQ